MNIEKLNTEKDNIFIKEYITMKYYLNAIKAKQLSRGMYTCEKSISIIITKYNCLSTARMMAYELQY